MTMITHFIYFFSNKSKYGFITVFQIYYID